MTALISAMQTMRTNRENSSPTPIPYFSGRRDESAEEFLLRYARCAIVHNWNDSDKLKTLIWLAKIMPYVGMKQINELAFSQTSRKISSTLSEENLFDSQFKKNPKKFKDFLMDYNQP